MVTITVTDFNEAPDFEVEEDPEDYEENGEDAVATFMGLDPEGADVIWTTGGTDGSLFTAEGGVLMFKDLPDYEDPKDLAHSADGDDADDDPDIEGDTDDPAMNNVYVLKVRATEDVPEDQVEPAKYTEIQVRVTVTNKNEMGMASILVRQPQVGVELEAMASDPDTRSATETDLAIAFAWTWSVPKVSRPVTDNDDHWVAAAGTSNAAEYTPLAGDVGSVLRAQATYTDGTGEERTLNILTEFEVRAAPADNNAPNAFDATDNTRTVDENSPMGTLVGPPVTTTDSNPGDVLYYTIPAAGASNPFAIDKITGQITVAGTVHFEATDGNGPAYNVTVTARDPSGQTSTIPMTITAKDVNENPTVAEAANPDKTTDEIDSTPTDSDGTPDLGYEYASGLSNLEYTKADVDADDGTTFSLAGEDAGQFDMEVSTTNEHVLTLSFKNPPDYDKPGDADKDNTYKVSVVATDKAGLTGMADVEIVVSDVSEDGTVTVSPGQPAIGRPVTATLSEPDTEVSGLKWQWQGSTDGTNFTDIEDADSDTYTPKAAVPDDEATEAVNEAVDSDEGLFLRAVATYTDAAAPLTAIDDDDDAQVAQTAMGDSDHAVRAAPDVNGPPAFESASMMREVMENAEEGDDVGDEVEATDPDGDDLTYAITGGADMDKFGIDEDTGQIKVGSAEFDYDDPSAQQTFEVELTASDPFARSGSTMVTITVTDFNEAPTLMLVAPETPVTPPVEPENNAPEFADDATTREVAENTAADMAVGAPVDGDGRGRGRHAGLHAGRRRHGIVYAIDAATGQIMTSAALDYETKASYAVTVTASDGEDSDSIDRGHRVSRTRVWVTWPTSMDANNDEMI